MSPSTEPTTTSTANGTSNVNQSIENAKNTILSSKSAVDTVANHPLTQNVKDTITSGPVAENLKDQSAKTQAEFQSLADSRKMPAGHAATGQNLTHYHSFFYDLFSWKHPRVTAIAYLSSVVAILALRYMPVLELSLKALFYTLLITASSEFVGQKIFGSGLASSFRPRKYYTIPRESLEASLGDAEQLINFFVIETQRILFAERVPVTVAAFLASGIAWGLVKLLPLWGLTLVALSTIYLAPLVYISNKEFIDSNLNHVSNVVNEQVAQVSDIAATHTANARDTINGYAGEYIGKAQDLMGSRRSPSPTTTLDETKKPANVAPSGPTVAPGNAPNLQATDFPHAPKQEPVPGVVSHQEKYEESKLGGNSEPSLI